LHPADQVTHIITSLAW